MPIVFRLGESLHGTIIRDGSTYQTRGGIEKNAKFNCFSFGIQLIIAMILR